MIYCRKQVFAFLIFNIIVVMLLLCSFSTNYCQESEDNGQSIPTNQIFSPLDLRERLLLEESLKLLPKEVLPLEGPINPDEYIVGPGDILLVSLWGELEGNFVASVYPQGNIVLPTLGSINVMNLSLSDLNEEVKKRAREFYPSSKVTTSLYGIRKFTIHVTGEVNQRESYTATPLNRVATAIKMAGGVTNWANKREIQVTHRNGDVEVFDLFEYEREGNLAKNPMLRGGDVIYVPRLQLSKGRVLVEGNIANPGYYQFYDGENLAEFLRRIGLQKETTDWEQAFIERTIESGNVEKINLPLDVIESGQESETSNQVDLQDNDRLFLPKKIDQVYVHGAVLKPGAYPFTFNFKAIDYVGMAGRYDKSGGQKAIKVIRRSDGSTVPGSNTIIERGDIIIVPLKKTATLLEYLQFVAPVTSLILTAVAVGIITVK